jgi:hypothetical protein
VRSLEETMGWGSALRVMDARIKLILL